MKTLILVTLMAFVSASAARAEDKNSTALGVGAGVAWAGCLVGAGITVKPTAGGIDTAIGACVVVGGLTGAAAYYGTKALTEDEVKDPEQSELNKLDE